MAEQRYQAVKSVIADGLSITQVAEKTGMSRQTLHAWLARYEAVGLEALVDRSHRPVSCPHQMPVQVEAQLLELRRTRARRDRMRRSAHHNPPTCKSSYQISFVTRVPDLETL